MSGETAYMHLVDDAVDQWGVQRLVATPLEAAFRHDAVSHGQRVGFERSPLRSARQHSRIRIEQLLWRIIAIDSGIGIGLHGEAKGIVGPGIESLDEDMPDLASTIGVWIEENSDGWCLRSRLEQQQPARSSVLGEDREVHACATYGGSQRQGMPLLNGVGWRHSRLRR